MEIITTTPEGTMTDQHNTYLVDSSGFVTDPDGKVYRVGRPTRDQYDVLLRDNGSLPPAPLNASRDACDGLGDPIALRNWNGTHTTCQAVALPGTLQRHSREKVRVYLVYALPNWDSPVRDDVGYEVWAGQYEGGTIIRTGESPVRRTGIEQTALAFARDAAANSEPMPELGPVTDAFVPMRSAR